ncbi:MAG: NYN domain-containing protein, partial [Patescibacteria group bacterium]
ITPRNQRVKEDSYFDALTTAAYEISGEARQGLGVFPLNPLILEFKEAMAKLAERVTADQVNSLAQKQRTTQATSRRALLEGEQADEEFINQESKVANILGEAWAGNKSLSQAVNDIPAGSELFALLMLRTKLIFWLQDLDSRRQLMAENFSGAEGRSVRDYLRELANDPLFSSLPLLPPLLVSLPVSPALPVPEEEVVVETEPAPEELEQAQIQAREAAGERQAAQTQTWATITQLKNVLRQTVKLVAKGDLAAEDARNIVISVVAALRGAGISGIRSNIVNPTAILTSLQTQLRTRGQLAQVTTTLDLTDLHQALSQQIAALQQLNEKPRRVSLAGQISRRAGDLREFLETPFEDDARIRQAIAETYDALKAEGLVLKTPQGGRPRSLDSFVKALRISLEQPEFGGQLTLAQMTQIGEILAGLSGQLAQFPVAKAEATVVAETAAVVSQAVSPAMITTPENLEIKNALRPEYERAVASLPEILPSSFRRQARLAAYIFQALETGEKLETVDRQDLTPLVERFAEDFIHTGFAWLQYTLASLYRLDVSSAYPAWVYARLQSISQSRVSLTDQQLKDIGEFIKNYGQQHASSQESFPNGYYYFFYSRRGVGEAGRYSLAHNNKLYIEGAELAKLDQLPQFFDLLAQKGLHPHSLKLFDQDRLVMFWDTLSAEQAQEINQIMTSLGLRGRGPAQDPVEIMDDPDKPGEPKFEVFWSNDSALGEGGQNRFIWDIVTYNPEFFFRQWLKLTFVAGKNPADPYSLSFIQARIPENVDPTEFIRKAAQLDSAGLPLLPTSKFLGPVDLFNQPELEAALSITPKPVAPAPAGLAVAAVTFPRGEKLEKGLKVTVTRVKTDGTQETLEGTIIEVSRDRDSAKSQWWVKLATGESLWIPQSLFKEEVVGELKKITAQAEAFNKFQQAVIELNQATKKIEKGLTLKGAGTTATALRDYFKALNAAVILEQNAKRLNVLQTALTNLLDSARLATFPPLAIFGKDTTLGLIQKAIANIKVQLKSLSPPPPQRVLLDGVAFTAQPASAKTIIAGTKNIGDRTIAAAVFDEHGNSLYAFSHPGKGAVLGDIVRAIPAGWSIVLSDGTKPLFGAGKTAVGDWNTLTLPECVTGDTKLRRRKKKKGKFTDEWEDVPIKDIEPGDEILSLNEATGKLVRARVVRLLSKGTQSTLRLTTASGASIQTTATHPYFVNMHQQKARSDKRRIAIFVDDANMFYAQKRAGWKIDWKKLLRTLSWSGTVVYSGYYMGMPKGKGGRRNRKIISDRRGEGYTVVTKPVKVIVDGASGKAFWKCNFDVEMARDVTTLVLQKKVTDIVIVSGDSDFAVLAPWAMSQGVKTTMMCFSLYCPYEIRSKPHTYFEDIRGMMEQKKTPAKSEGEVTVPILSYTPFAVKDGAWQLADHVKRGQQILAVGTDGRPRWDTVVSVTAEKRHPVFDIEIEGTHNFVGNGIVAHNTTVLPSTWPQSQPTMTVEGVTLTLADQEAKTADQLPTNAASVRIQDAKGALLLIEFQSLEHALLTYPQNATYVGYTYVFFDASNAPLAAFRNIGGSRFEEYKRATGTEAGSEFSVPAGVTPITQTTTAYRYGEEEYDESFSIDSSAGDFLGEYGVGQSETIGTETPAKMIALEVWLFDKGDTKTQTKYLLTPQAFSDREITAVMASKGEPVEIQKGKQYLLRTKNFDLLVTVVALEYSDGKGTAPDSYLEKVTLDFKVYPRDTVQPVTTQAPPSTSHPVRQKGVEQITQAAIERVREVAAKLREPETAYNDDAGYRSAFNELSTFFGEVENKTFDGEKLVEGKTLATYIKEVQAKLVSGWLAFRLNREIEKIAAAVAEGRVITNQDINNSVADIFNVPELANVLPKNSRMRLSFTDDSRATLVAVRERAQAEIVRTELAALLREARRKGASQNLLAVVIAQLQVLIRKAPKVVKEEVEAAVVEVQAVLAQVKAQAESEVKQPTNALERLRNVVTQTLNPSGEEFVVETWETQFTHTITTLATQWQKLRLSSSAVQFARENQEQIVRALVEQGLSKEVADIHAYDVGRELYERVLEKIRTFMSSQPHVHLTRYYDQIPHEDRQEDKKLVHVPVNRILDAVIDDADDWGTFMGKRWSVTGIIGFAQTLKDGKYDFDENSERAIILLDLGGGVYTAIDGTHRVASAKIAGIPTVKARVITLKRNQTEPWKLLPADIQSEAGAALEKAREIVASLPEPEGEYAYNEEKAKLTPITATFDDTPVGKALTRIVEEMNTEPAFRGISRATLMRVVNALEDTYRSEGPLSESLTQPLRPLTTTLPAAGLISATLVQIVQTAISQIDDYYIVETANDAAKYIERTIIERLNDEGFDGEKVWQTVKTNLAGTTGGESLEKAMLFGPLLNVMDTNNTNKGLEYTASVVYPELQKQTEGVSPLVEEMMRRISRAQEDYREEKDAEKRTNLTDTEIERVVEDGLKRQILDEMNFDPEEDTVFSTLRNNQRVLEQLLERNGYTDKEKTLLVLEDALYNVADALRQVHRARITWEQNIADWEKDEQARVKAPQIDLSAEAWSEEEKQKVEDYFA